MYCCLIFTLCACVVLKIEPKDPVSAKLSRDTNPQNCLAVKNTNQFEYVICSQYPALSVLWNCWLLNTHCYKNGHCYSRCISNLSHCCDQITEHSSVRKAGAGGLFELIVVGYSPLGWERECRRSLSQLASCISCQGNMQAADSLSLPPSLLLSFGPGPKPLKRCCSHLGWILSRNSFIVMSRVLSPVWF